MEIIANSIQTPKPRNRLVTIAGSIRIKWLNMNPKTDKECERFVVKMGYLSGTLYTWPLKRANRSKCRACI